MGTGTTCLQSPTETRDTLQGKSSRNAFYWNVEPTGSLGAVSSFNWNHTFGKCSVLPSSLPKQQEQIPTFAVGFEEQTRSCCSSFPKIPQADWRTHPRFFPPVGEASWAQISQEKFWHRVPQLLGTERRIPSRHLPHPQHFVQFQVNLRKFGGIFFIFWKIPFQTSQTVTALGRGLRESLPGIIPFSWLIHPIPISPKPPMKVFRFFLIFFFSHSQANLITPIFTQQGKHCSALSQNPTLEHFVICYR